MHVGDRRLGVLNSASYVCSHFFSIGGIVKPLIGFPRPSTILWVKYGRLYRGQATLEAAWRDVDESGCDSSQSPQFGEQANVCIAKIDEQHLQKIPDYMNLIKSCNRPLSPTLYASGFLLSLWIIFNTFAR